MYFILDSFQSLPQNLKSTFHWLLVEVLNMYAKPFLNNQQAVFLKQRGNLWKVIAACNIPKMLLFQFILTSHTVSLKTHA